MSLSSNPAAWLILHVHDIDKTIPSLISESPAMFKWILVCNLWCRHEENIEVIWALIALLCFLFRRYFWWVGCPDDPYFHFKTVIGKLWEDSCNIVLTSYHFKIRGRWIKLHDREFWMYRARMKMKFVSQELK